MSPVPSSFGALAGGARRRPRRPAGTVFDTLRTEGADRGGRSIPARRLAAAAAMLAMALMAMGSAAPAPAPAPARAPAMSVLDAAVLGLVEGLTEYLPVSSTGHLILTQRLLGIGGASGDSDAANAYAIVIQAGAILAVLGLYLPAVRRVARGVFGQDREGLRLGLNLLIAFLPAAAIGLTLVDQIKAHLFSLRAVTLAWFAGGLLILVVARRRPDPEQPGDGLFAISARQALLIGLAQCLAVWPGISRSLVTIVGGLLVGLGMQTAVVFSFLLGAVTLGASTLYDSVHHGPLMLSTYGWTSILVGFGVAFGSALLAVRWMVGYLKRHGLALFGYYRIVLAAVVAASMLAGVLSGD